MHPVERYAADMWRRPDDYVKPKKKRLKPMNKKIKELRDKSLEKYVFADIDGENNHGSRLNEEKFADLIIKECINQVELTWMNQNGWSHNADCVKSIKQKFGIE